MSKTDQDLIAAQKAFSSRQYLLALQRYQSVLTQNPQNLEACLAMSSCLLALGQHDEALVVAKQVLNQAAIPLKKETVLQISNILFLQKRYLDSILTIENHIEFFHDTANQTLLANNYLSLGYPSKAVGILKPLFKSAPSITILQNLSIALCECMQVDEAIKAVIDYSRRHELNADLLSNTLMVSHYSENHLSFISELKGKVKSIFPAEKKSNKTNQSISLNANKPFNELRIAFFSSDLCQHPVGFFMLSFIGYLAKNCNVKIYDNGSPKDRLHNAINTEVQNIDEVKSLTDEQFCELIQKDGIDILIDLSGHTRGNRLIALAKKPAPIQVGYLGYFGSTYIDAFDAVIFDDMHLVELPLNYFSEDVYTLKTTRFCYYPPDYLPAIKELPSLKNGVITFGCFAHTAKFSNHCFDLWSCVLNAVPKSRLQLKWRTLRDPVLKETVWRQFELRGIASYRVELYVESDHDSLFCDYHQIDIALDTVPFSSVTTACEALSMGIPVITLQGNFPAANQTSSVLHAMNLDHLIAKCDDEYIAIASFLAHAEQDLLKLRLSLRNQMQQSVVGQGNIFAENFSKALETIFLNHQQ